jgi:hypothetical protein
MAFLLIFWESFKQPAKAFPNVGKLLHTRVNGIPGPGKAKSTSVVHFYIIKAGLP